MNPLELKEPEKALVSADAIVQDFVQLPDEGCRLIRVVFHYDCYR